MSPSFKPSKSGRHSQLLAACGIGIRVRSRCFEIARVLVRFDHVAHFTRSAAELEGLSQQLKLNKAIL